MALSSKELNDILLKKQNPQQLVQGKPKTQNSDTRNLSLLQKILPIAGGIGGGVIGGVVGGPVGAIAGGAIGSGIGQGLQEVSDQEQGVNTGRIVKETGFGLAGGLVGPGLKGLGLLGKAAPGIGKLAGAGGNVADDVVTRSANALLQGSDAQVAKALKFGISPQEELVRFIPKFSQRGANSLEQMVGATSKTGRQVTRGVLDDIIDEEVEFVDNFAKSAAGKVNITGNNVLASLEKRGAERKLLLNLGEDDAEIKAIDEFIAAARKKYAKGISLEDAVKTVREANRTFAASIASTEKGAVRGVAQKLEADALRDSLQQFPDIQRSLSDQQALLTLKPFLKNSAVKFGNDKFNFSQLDVTRPGTVVDMVMNNPRVAQKTVKYGSKIPGAGATQVAAGTKSEALAKAAPSLKSRLFKTTLSQGAARVLSGAATPQETNTYNKLTSLDEGITRVSQMEENLLDQVQQIDSTVSEGIQLADGTSITKDNIKQMYLQDFATTGGKNLTKIAALEKGLFTDEAEKKVSAEVQKQTIGLNASEAALSQIEQQLETIGLGEGLGQRVRGSVLKAQGVFGENADVKAYQDWRKAMVGFLAKSLAGQVGSLSDKDVERAEGFLPSITDTKKEAAIKLANARAFIQSRKQALMSVPQTMSSGQYPDIPLAE